MVAIMTVVVVALWNIIPYIVENSYAEIVSFLQSAHILFSQIYKYIMRFLLKSPF